MKKEMLPVRLLLAGLLLTANANTVLAQASTAGDPAASNPQLKLSPMKTLQTFEPAENEEYALGPGDEISLDFPGRPELSGKKSWDQMDVLRCRWPAPSTSQTRTETRSLS
jgi:protein involved in polysaccharide export with SLBB domain